MSGGTWDYVQNKLMHIAVDIELETERQNYEEETLQNMAEAVNVIRCAAIYIERIDWLMAGDDDDDSFNRRLKEQLSKLRRNL